MIVSHPHDNVRLSNATAGQMAQELSRRGANGWIVYELGGKDFAAGIQGPGGSPEKFLIATTRVIGILQMQGGIENLSAFDQARAAEEHDDGEEDDETSGD